MCFVLGEVGRAGPDRGYGCYVVVHGHSQSKQRSSMHGGWVQRKGRG